MPASAEMTEVKDLAGLVSAPPPISAAVRAAVARKASELGLTHKQHTYAELLCSGMSQIDAYRSAYDCDPEAKTTAVDACVVAKNPKIVQTVAEGRAAMNHARTLSERGKLTRERIDQRLAELMETDDANVALRAAKLAGEQAHVQAYAKRKEAEDAADAVAAFDFLAELQQNAREQLGYTGPVIDVQAVHSVGILQAVDSTRTAITLIHPLVELPDWCLPGAD